LDIGSEICYPVDGFNRIAHFKVILKLLRKNRVMIIMTRFTNRIYFGHWTLCSSAL
jgi:hypothetical protein